MALAGTLLYASADARLARVVCDGVDPARARVEPTAGDQVVVVLRGAFELREGRRRAVVDPSLACVLRDGAEHVFRHPCGGGDVCLSVGGPLAARLARSGPGLRPIGAARWARLAALARAGGAGGPAEPGAEAEFGLALEEALCDAFAGGDAPARPGRDGELAEQVAHVLRRRPDARLSLAELGAAVGYSEFHLCRAFRRATGSTVQAFHLELRLRHALALVLDTRRPLADVALATGFAGQAHLTNRFRARFGVTPGRARAGSPLRAPAGLAG